MELAAPLAMELEVFERHRKEWSRVHLGEFVVIRDSQILDGFFETYSDAFKSGLQKFGASQSFLVKQIWVTEPVYFIA
jgi:hypothetical protein